MCMRVYVFVACVCMYIFVSIIYDVCMYVCMYIYAINYSSNDIKLYSYRSV